MALGAFSAEGGEGSVDGWILAVDVALSMRRAWWVYCEPVIEDDDELFRGDDIRAYLTRIVARIPVA